VLLVVALALPVMASQAVKIFVNGQEMKTDVPAQIVDGRTLVPLRAIAEGLGQKVDWDNETKTATITGGALDKVNAISAEYSSSLHKELSGARVDRSGCIACHDGNGFENSDYEWVEGNKKGLACESCHSGNGEELLETGLVELPFMAEPYEAGASALCMTCHSGRRDVDADYAKVTDDGFRTELRYPHYAAAALLVTGTGMEIPGYEYAQSAAHTNIEDSCISCHMPKTEEGYKTHNFGADVAYADQTCGTCHGSVDSFNINGYQTEITKIKEKVKKAVVDAVPGAVEMTTSHGQLAFKNAAGEYIDAGEVPQAAYIAAYNYKLVDYDGSKGVHNPKYAKSLLLNSYKNLTGKDMVLE
ncbi:MAG: ammonia-forming cytochrome c nitrite reductase subunit c552, partial [Bacillota bacterium]|nr:ammonia-forming cytochrome c nitrite reductase subunit c552 [Bacillota bacterium]